jgi:hypothetical protein
MEAWNNGILECWVWWNEIYFYANGTHKILKSGHHPLLQPSIPSFQHSTIPVFILRRAPHLWDKFKAYQ